MTSREHDVAALADLPDGTMQAVTAGDTKVLLARMGGTVHAVSGTCPQAGGPLAEGVQIVVNGTLQAADALFAAGDIAAFSHTGNGRRSGWSTGALPSSTDGLPRGTCSAGVNSTTPCRFFGQFSI